ncbi:hypothetical protein OCU04_003549 [Sclerotinia nivalis]|uniref:Uncharacterized protein n=1 Tax=Sclerotinia nivalis TaxID=352851 RepID=A0A9X0DLY5_9HELO|nr:hypothetical protein OCU04_003549 [Sclerotinia nivalis]
MGIHAPPKPIYQQRFTLCDSRPSCLTIISFSHLVFIGWLWGLCVWVSRIVLELLAYHSQSIPTLVFPSSKSFRHSQSRHIFGLNRSQNNIPATKKGAIGFAKNTISSVNIPSTSEKYGRKAFHGLQLWGLTYR